MNKPHEPVPPAPPLDRFHDPASPDYDPNQDLKDRAARPAGHGAAAAAEAHPVGAAAGAVAGMAAGALGGLAAGPVGSLFGAAAGAVLGAMAGSTGSTGAGEPIDDTAWREHHRHLSDAAGDFDAYAPAYRFGDVAFRRAAATGKRRWDDVETELASVWPEVRGTSPLDWHVARKAARAAWDGAERSAPTTGKRADG